MKAIKKKLYEDAFNVYKSAMQDCQIPTGALAELSPIEYYAFTLSHQHETSIKQQEFEPEIPSKQCGIVMNDTERQVQQIIDVLHWQSKCIKDLARQSTKKGA